MIKNEHKKDGKYISFFSDVLIFGIGIVLAKAIQFMLMPVYTSYLSEAQYGRGELINSLSDLLLPVVTLNLYEAGFRYIAARKYRNDQLYSTILKIFMKSAIIGAVIAGFIRVAFGWKYACYLYLDLYGYAFLWILSYLAKGQGDSKTFSISGVINALSLLAFSVLFIVLLGGGEIAYLMAISLAYVPSCIFLLLRNRTYKLISLKKYDADCKKELLAYGIPLMVYNLGYWLVTVSGRYVLLFFKGESQVGLYVAAMKISALMNMVFQAANASFQLNAVKQYEEVKKEEYYSNSFVIIESSFYSMAAILILFSSFISNIILKKGFIAADIYTPLIVFAATLYAVSSLYGMLYSIYIKPKRNIPCIFISAMINICVAVIFVNKIGVWAICIASVACYLFQITYRVIDVRSFSKAKIRVPLLIVNLLLLAGEVYAKTVLSNFVITTGLCLLVIIISIVRVYVLWTRIEH